VWTSGAHRAKWAIVLARTDPDAVKHAGLTQFVLDMTDPGVTVRPLRQMSGGVEFNEVFLNDVRIPDSERLGGVGDGWAVSQHTLVYERYNMPRVSGRGEGMIAPLVDAWEARADKTSPAARALKNELMRHWVDVEVLRLLQLRASVARAQGKTGAEGSLGKLAVSILMRRLGEWAPVLLGAEGMLIDNYDAPEEVEVPTARRGSTTDGPYVLQKSCVNSPGIAIAGGTDQIQRNIIGDRVLGLPREPAADKGLPWSQTLRS
jgi:alkylation response protein AidB-like acyl-CoA dehydrogenase